MSYETLTCNECGALIQVPTVARYVTCNRCGAQLAVQRTGVATYTEAARRPPEPDAPAAAGREMADRLDRLETETELTRIDREWDMERERYLMTARYGQRYVPSTVASVVMGVLVVCFGVFWTVIAFSMAGGMAAAGGGAVATIFPLFGFVAIIAGLAASIYQFSKAQQYQAAYQAYQRRRATAEERLRN